MSLPPANRPVSAAVYRRRRLVVFGGLGLIVLTVLLLIFHPWTGSANSGSQGSQSVIPNATSTAQASVSATAAVTAACTTSQVQVTAYTDAESYAAGQNPQLTMEVENTGNQPCTLNVGTSQQVFTITSGSEIYWLSTDCQTESSDYDLVLEPGQAVKSEPIVWDRTRSNPGTCTLTTRDPVPAAGATYHLTAAVDGVSSAEAAQFTLN